MKHTLLWKTLCLLVLLAFIVAQGQAAATRAAGATPVPTPAPSAAATPGASATTMPVQTGQHAYTFEEKGGTPLNYLLFLPRDYEKDAQKTWPLILFLHGMGERGSKLADLELVKKNGPPRLVEQKPELPFIVLSPQLPTSAGYWALSLSSVSALLDEIVATYRVDTTRLYVTGLSMGGYGTWSLAIEYPERFAALVPVAGGYATGDPQDACKLKRVPIWVFHGAKDTRVDPSESEVMVDALKGCGGNVRFTLFPDEGHDDHMWARVYDDPELYDWLLQQVKAETTPAPSASATPVPTSNSHYELVVGSHPRIPTRIRE